jgi:hypothetical protein
VSRLAGGAAAAACALALVVVPSALAAGSFLCSDPQLTQIWQASVRTADDTVQPPVDLDPRGCVVDLPLVILDSPIRDRCPYIGDLAVTGMTLLVSGGDTNTLRATIQWFADHQHADGAIPATPDGVDQPVLIDYNAYWIEALYDYTLYTGDRSLLGSDYDNLVQLVDGLYPAHVDSAGLLENWLGNADYAYIARTGPVVSYYNAQYVRALGMAAALARWEGDTTRAASWLARTAPIRTAFQNDFWDPSAGAFTDSAGNRAAHPLDGNVFAILAGLATRQQQASILAFVDRTLRRSVGDAIVDTNVWDRPGGWGINGPQRIIPFISYFELLARFDAGDDAGAFGLIRREWGYMLSRGPGTMWESIDSGTGQPITQDGSRDHGWSSGAAPALSSFVLGVLPTSPGFATFTVTPHPGNLTWVQGSVPTPHGPIAVSWKLVKGKPVVRVTAPPGTQWTNPPAPAPTPTKAAAVRAPGSRAMSPQLVSQLLRER